MSLEHAFHLVRLKDFDCADSFNGFDLDSGIFIHDDHLLYLTDTLGWIEASCIGGFNRYSLFLAVAAP